MAMDAHIKAVWVFKLRSGEYNQTTGTLHDHQGMCCLGVLAEAIGCEWKPSDNNYWIYRPVFESTPGRESAKESITSIPVDIRHEIGLSGDNQRYL